MNKMCSHIFLFLKRLQNDNVGVARGTELQYIRPGADFKTGEFVKQTLGGLP